MPKLNSERLPKYRKHKASGQAIVTLGGHDHYLGPYGTAARKREYDRLTAEWLANGRVGPAENDTTIVELLAAFRRHALKHYRKDGRPTSQLHVIDYAIRPLKRLYGSELVRTFGPLKLQALQALLVREGLARTTINKNLGVIKQIFRWGVSQELCPQGLAHALATVRGLQRGRTEAREPEPIKPAGDAVVDATLPHLPAVVADMVRFQRLTGCRPGEVCILRPRDLNRAGDVWTYKPASHKTEHHGRERLIFVGPKAQNVLRPYLLRAPDDYCFRPCDSEAKRKAERREARKTPVQPSQVDRSKPNARWRPGDRYVKDAYNRVIRRACDLADRQAHAADPTIATDERIVPRWSPNQLRHSMATEVRRRYGLEAVQVVLGHATANVTQIYAERDLGLAAKIMREVG